MKYKMAFRWVGLSFLFLAICLMTLSTAWGAEKKEIVIGSPLPLTGGLGMAALEEKWAYEQAVSEINKAGGIFVKEYGKKLRVKLILADAESDPGKWWLRWKSSSDWTTSIWFYRGLILPILFQLASSQINTRNIIIPLLASSLYGWNTSSSGPHFSSLILGKPAMCLFKF